MNDKDDALDEIVREFLVESAENLDQLDRDLVSLERDPTSRDLLAGIFRAVHTIKGTTGFLGFARLEQVAHRAENLLSKLRDGALELDTARTNILLEVSDTVRAILAHIEATGNDDDGRDRSDLLARLAELQEARAQGPGEVAIQTAPSQKTPGPASPVAEEIAREPQNEDAIAPEGETKQAAAPSVVTATAKTTAPKRPARNARGAGTAPATQATAPKAEPTAPVPAAAREETPSPTPRSSQDVPATVSLSAAEHTVRVDVDLLDGLMRQMGELVLARNQLVSHGNDLDDGGRALQRLSLIVSELQEGVTKTRMQPVEQLWAKLPRVVRDLAKQFSKEVDLSLEGGDTELDRSVLEAVKDPLTHLVRNALDHGIEGPAEREAAGKRRVGNLRLSASHQNGKVVLEMADDGAGIDPERVGAKAVEKGLVTPERLAQMTTREITDLVFQPGFSTAKQISNISGRGVGMDVVRTNIERIGGTVDLASTPRAGTTVRIKIPLTLAIIPALLVTARGSMYALAQAAVQELVHLEGAALREQVERVDTALLYRLRGHLLPLLRLDEALGYETTPFESQKALDIVIAQADGEPFGLVVDRVEGTQEIVVKPLAHQLKNLPVYAGATVLGDGSVALILDVAGLADSGSVREGRAAAQGGEVRSSEGGRAEALLLLRVGGERRVAVPLGLVERLEEVGAQQLEHAGNRRALQYRGELLPIVWLAEVLAIPAETLEGRRLPVVVCSDGERSVGLVAEQILDVVEEVVNVDAIGAAQGVLGTAVVQGRATDFLDLLTAAEYAGVVFRPSLDLSLSGVLSTNGPRPEVAANAS
jgi:two-component system chemotaxis sensor kinase CheA